LKAEQLSYDQYDKKNDITEEDEQALRAS